MQVYLVLWSDGNKGKRMIVGTKRWVNDFWQSKTHGDYKAQNQSGQYSLNGGSANKNEPYEDAAKREFWEETGLSKARIAAAKTLYTNNESYAVVAAKFEQDDLLCLFARMNANVDYNPSDASRPAGTTVVDWEFDSFEMITVDEASNYLGERRPVPDQWTVGDLKFSKSRIENKIAELEQQNKFSQSIDWFGDIARALPDKLR